MEKTTRSTLQPNAPLIAVAAEMAKMSEMRVATATNGPDSVPIPLHAMLSRCQLSVCERLNRPRVGRLPHQRRRSADALIWLNVRLIVWAVEVEE